MTPAADSDGLSGNDEEPDPGEEQDLLVVLRLSNRQMGTREERAALARLADELEQAVIAHGVGAYDGDEVGGGECILFFCGPDTERLIAVLRPLLRRSPLAAGAVFERLAGDGGHDVRRERLPV